MKTTTFVTSTLAFLMSTSLLAGMPAPALNGILCVSDQRPVDGMYSEILLQNTGKGFSLISTTISSGFTINPSAPVPEVKLLATGLDCNIDGVIAYCFKSSAASGDATNSFVEFSMIEKTSMNSLFDKKATKAEPTIEIKVLSPLVTGLDTSFTFNAAECHGQ